MPDRATARPQLGHSVKLPAPRSITPLAKLNPPMSEMCSFLAFEALKSKLVQVADFVNFLKPEFIEDIAEPCTLDEV
jgi:hypothetical protein